MASRQYADFDVLMRQVGDEYEGRVVESPVGETSEIRFALPFSDLDLERFLLRIGHARRRVRSADSQRLAEIRDFGGALFDAVFHDQIGICLRRSLDRVDGENKGLRIRLRMPSNRLADVPWEFLYDRASGRFLCLSEHTPVVRYIEMPESPPRVQVNGPLRMLVVISSPSDYPPLDVEQEWANVQTAVSGLMSGRRLEIERLEVPTLDGLRRALRRTDFHVLHFIGHGGVDHETGDGILVLQDETGMSRLEPGRDLSTLLYDERSLQLVVLNSCEGARAEGTDPFAGTAQALVRQGVLAVLAMQFEITDDAAIIFGRNFYEALADGLPVDAATNSARKAVFATSRTEWGTPVLYMRAPDGGLFRDVRPAPVGSSADAANTPPASPEPRPQLSAPPDDRLAPRPGEEDEATPNRRRSVLVAGVVLAAIAGLTGYVLVSGGDGDQDGPTSITPELVSRIGDVCEGRSTRMAGVNDLINEAITSQDVSAVQKHLATWSQFQRAFIDQMYKLDLSGDTDPAMGQEEEAQASLQFAAESGDDPDAILPNLISAQSEYLGATARWSELGVSCSL